MDLASVMKLPGNDPKVKYMGPEDGPFECDDCRYFIADRKPCHKVSTPVEKHGCCNLFKPE